MKKRSLAAGALIVLAGVVCAGFPRLDGAVLQPAGAASEALYRNDGTEYRNDHRYRDDPSEGKASSIIDGAAVLLGGLTGEGSGIAIGALSGSAAGFLYDRLTRRRASSCGQYETERRPASGSRRADR